MKPMEFHFLVGLGHWDLGLAWPKLYPLAPVGSHCFIFLSPCPMGHTILQVVSWADSQGELPIETHPQYGNMLSIKTIQIGGHNVNWVWSKTQFYQMILKVYLPTGLNSKIKQKGAKAHFNKQSWMAIILPNFNMSNQFTCTHMYIHCISPNDSKVCTFKKTKRKKKTLPRSKPAGVEPLNLIWIQTLVAYAWVPIGYWSALAPSNPSWAWPGPLLHLTRPWRAQEWC